MSSALRESLINQLQDVMPDSVITDPAQLDSYLREERGLYQGSATLVIAPSNTEELAMAVKICSDAGAPMVPQGGNTGLVGGSVSSAAEVVVSLRRMNKIRSVDPVNYTITVEAGCVLQSIQQAAKEQDCLFPLSIGSQGSCVIGGNIASNAGGVGVIKYGNTRELTLGLEVVLPDGQIWNGMRSLYKDNSGYALKDLFIGSEGSLGIITAAVMKLYPRPRQMQTAFCAVPSVDAALALLSLARRQSGDQVTAFELISDFSSQLVCEHAGARMPLEPNSPWYTLIEFSTSRAGTDMRELVEFCLSDAMERDWVTDAVIAESLQQTEEFWHIRERISEVQQYAGGSIKHDVSVPVSRIPEFLRLAGKAVTDYMPGLRICAFGHLGDGNIHYNLSQPVGMDKQEYLGHWGAMNNIVHPIVASLDGSIAAEHGIGLLKVDEVKQYRSEAEQSMMHSIKNAFDPQNVMNPGKLV